MIVEVTVKGARQTEATIREAAQRLDDALEARDLAGVVACFDEQCEVEILGMRLRGRDGVRHWLDWVFGQIESLRFEPRLITVDGATLAEEFVVEATLPGGRRRVRSCWAEVLDYDANLVRSLRLYFNPLDFLEAKGIVGRLAAPVARRFTRHGLGPFEPIR
jgi:ketosteroid isomerase-like protein